MSSLSELIESLDLPEAKPIKIPPSVAMVANALGLSLVPTSPSVPEQYEVMHGVQPCGYVRVRWGGMSISYPDAGGESLYEGAVDGFGGFTDHEREAKLLLALGLIAAQMLK